MVAIVAGIRTLVQHVQHLQIQPEDYRPETCVWCGLKGLWVHGCYVRKANGRGLARDTDKAILIPRYRCRAPGCGKTCSVLPEAIAPRRHYLWEVQQLAVFLLASGVSLNKTARLLSPSRHTLRRWWQRFQQCFVQHAAALRSRFPELGRTQGLSDFWLVCLAAMDLSSAMVELHRCGVEIP